MHPNRYDPTRVHPLLLRLTRRTLGLNTAGLLAQVSQTLADTRRLMDTDSVRAAPVRSPPPQRGWPGVFSGLRSRIGEAVRLFYPERLTKSISQASCFPPGAPAGGTPAQSSSC